jgi:GDP-L-fucose synthase
MMVMRMELRHLLHDPISHCKGGSRRIDEANEEFRGDDRPMNDLGFWNGRRVLVPGGAGFIGSHLCEHLAEMGARVTALDNLSSGSWRNLDPAAGEIQQIEADVTDSAAAGFFKTADVVMNLAGLAPGLTADPSRHERLFHRNVEIADAVLRAVISHRVPRLLVVSSSCVYPDDAPVPTPEYDPAGTEPERANRGYGLAKREIEAAALLAAAEFPHLQIAIARPFNVFGERDRNGGPGAHVIPALLERLAGPDPQIVVWGSGGQTRSFIHASDVARALALLTVNHAVADPVNIGDGREVSIRELLELLMEISGIRKPVTFDRTKPEGAARKACDAGKLRRVTGFTPRISLEEGLRRMCSALRS